MAAVFPAIILVAMVLALIDIIMRDEWQVRHLPKVAWLLLVILVPLIGTVLWFVIGREYSSSSLPAGLGSLARPRPGTHPQADLPRPHVDTRTTEEQLAELDREIEYYQRRAELERLKREAEGEGDRNA